MSSLTEIYFDYNQAMAQAAKLDDIGQRLTNAANQNMEQVLKEINAAWKSDSSPRYIEKGRHVKDDMRETAARIREIAETIRKIAKRILDAELEAWRIANERKG